MIVLRLAIWLLAAALAATIFPSPTVTKHVRPFLIYYGGLPTPASAASAQAMAGRFAGYPIVVFGNGWRDPSFAERVMRDAPDVRFYGYADTAHGTRARVQATLAELAQMHMSGVLLDEVGYGLSANTQTLQAVVDAAHRLHLRVLLNAWNPAVVLPLHLIAGKDGVLCENWVYSDGQWTEPRDAPTYAALRRLQGRGLLVFMDLTTARPPRTSAPLTLPVRRTVYYEYGDYVAVSDANYSAITDAVWPAWRLNKVLERLSY